MLGDYPRFLLLSWLDKAELTAIKPDRPYEGILASPLPTDTV